MMQVQRVKRGSACQKCAQRKRKCTHVQEIATPKNLEPVRFDCYRFVLQVPGNEESKLGSELVDTMIGLRLDHTWLRMVPGRLGRSEVVDKAIKAVVSNKRTALFRSSPNTNGGIKSYVQAVEAVRRALSTEEQSITDETLMAVALLCVCQSMMQSELFICFAHWGAMAAILLARPASWHHSDFTRAIFYHIRNQTFGIPCAQGRASPFDRPTWYNLQPVSIHGPTPALKRLRFLGNQILVRLPRLIMHIRSLRNGNTCADIEQEALSITLDLESLEDSMAESELLHQIKVVETIAREDARFLPVSFEYNDIGELETMVIYWKARIIFSQLQFHVLELCSDYTVDTHVVRASMERMSFNCLMSLQFARSRQQKAHASGMVALPTALIALYTIWQNIEEYRGIHVDEWRKWHVERVNEAVAVYDIHATLEQVAGASEAIAGGPAEGMFAAAFNVLRVTRDGDGVALRAAMPAL